MQNEEGDRSLRPTQDLPRGPASATTFEQSCLSTPYPLMNVYTGEGTSFANEMDSSTYGRSAFPPQYSYAEELADLHYAPLGYMPVRGQMPHTVSHQMPYENITFDSCFEQTQANVPYGYIPYDFFSADGATDLPSPHSLPSISTEERRMGQKQARCRPPTTGFKRPKKLSRPKFDHTNSVDCSTKFTDQDLRLSSTSEGTQDHPKKVTFRLQIRQEPVHARMCGLGEKDRRPIDPPPIIQCVQVDSDGTSMIDPPRDPTFSVHATLWSEDGSQERNTILTYPGKRARSKPDESTSLEQTGKVSRVLMGSLVTSPIVLNDENGIPGCFHVFQDLSIRTEGIYRLKFTLFSLSMADCMTPGTSVAILDECITAPFIVYPAKKFPGMLTSTEVNRFLLLC